MSPDDELARRLAALSPAQRRLLEQRMRAEGIERSAAGRAEAGRDSRRGESARESEAPAGPEGDGRGLRFSLFFFSADGSAAATGKYDLLLECARFADANGFTAVWTPERHFQDFGGLYPNPSLLAAALATVTSRVQLRAGSVVLPLHHPVRLAEEWSVVDNLSNGRAAISCASGWHPDDFVLAPERFAERREVTSRWIATLRRLWAGEAVPFAGPEGREIEVRILPRPVQSELPMWLTTSGSEETWRRAGELGMNVLAALANQSPDDLARRIGAYRETRAQHGHDPGSGIVSVMLHTFLGEDLHETRRLARDPLMAYLGTHMQQRDSYLPPGEVRSADREALLELAHDHYVERASLIGTPDSCARLLRSLERAGVDEIACLVDFGVAPEAVRAGLLHLDRVRQRHAPREPAGATDEPRPGMGHEVAT